MDARPVILLLATILPLATGCGRKDAASQGPPQPLETFHWCGQPISFSPPPPVWYREGDNGGGMLGVRFVLSGGLGECISVLAYRQMAERNRGDALRRLLARRDSLSQNEFLREVSLARPPLDAGVSESESQAARAVNSALDQATEHYLSGSKEFVKMDLETAIESATSYKATLPELLNVMRLHPESMQEPERWKIGYEHDTTLAGLPAFMAEDTLITPDRPMLYQEVYWVVNGYAFKAVYQGTPPNLPAFRALVNTIQFPEETASAATR